MFARTFSAALIFSAAAAMQPAGAATFAPHRAVYEITLMRSSAGSGVSDMTGRMVYELTGSACEGYTQNMRFVTRSANSEGAETTNDLRTSSWEETDGKRLRFSSTQYQNEIVAEASQGDAQRQGQSRADGLKIDLTRPAKKKVTLTGDIFFPMQHAGALIDAAKAGQTLVSANVYDGSEKGETYYTTTAVIGNRVEGTAVASSVSVKNADRLPKTASWPMAVSYFMAGNNKQDAPPAYELSFRYFENGITEDLKIDYGEFAIHGEMKELEMLPVSKCN